MNTLGPYLRSAREAKGMDLRDAAQQTRISINYLKAIEEEDFAKLPGEVFVKGFLKSYARFLQLSEDEVMARYTAILRPPAGQAAAKAERPKASAVPSPVSEEPERGEKRSWEPYLWSGLVLIALAGLALILVPGHRTVTKTEAPVSSQSTSTQSLVSAPAATTASEKLYLEITALDDVWVLVRTDSSPQKKAILKKGESITWSADERFLVSYGSIGAARIVLNGKELTVTGPKQAVVRDLIITRSGIAYQKFEAEKPRPAITRPVAPKPITHPSATPAAEPSPVPPAPQPAAEPSEQPEPKPAPEPIKPMGSVVGPRE